MPYRYCKHIDVFPLSIDGAVYLNGNGDWNPLVWAFDYRSLYVGALSAVWGAMTRNDYSYPAAQWSQFGLTQLSDTLNVEHMCGPGVRMSLTVNDESCYFAVFRTATGSTRYRINERDSAFGLTELASTGDANSPTFTNMDWVRLEIDASGNMKMYTVEQNVVPQDAATLRLEATDTTIASGNPGMVMYQSNQTEAKSGAWAAGWYSSEPLVNTSIDFSDGIGPAQYNHRYGFSLPSLQNGDWSVGFAALPRVQGPQDTQFNYVLRQGALGEGSLQIRIQAVGTNARFWIRVWATGDAFYQDMFPTANSDGEEFCPHATPHFFVLQRRSGNIECFIVKKGSTVTVAQATMAAFSGPLDDVLGWNFDAGYWPAGEFFCFPTASLTPSEITSWAVGKPITAVKPDPHTYYAWRNGAGTTEPNKGTGGGVATLAGAETESHAFTYHDPFFLLPPVYGYGPDWQRMNTGLRR